MTTMDEMKNAGAHLLSASASSAPVEKPSDPVPMVLAGRSTAGGPNAQSPSTENEALVPDEKTHEAGSAPVGPRPPAGGGSKNNGGEEQEEQKDESFEAPSQFERRMSKVDSENDAIGLIAALYLSYAFSMFTQELIAENPEDPGYCTDWEYEMLFMIHNGTIVFTMMASALCTIVTSLLTWTVKKVSNTRSKAKFQGCPEDELVTKFDQEWDGNEITKLFYMTYKDIRRITRMAFFYSIALCFLGLLLMPNLWCYHPWMAVTFFTFGVTFTVALFLFITEVMDFPPKLEGKWESSDYDTDKKKYVVDKNPNTKLSLKIEEGKKAYGYQLTFKGRIEGDECNGSLMRHFCFRRYWARTEDGTQIDLWWRYQEPGAEKKTVSRCCCIPSSWKSVLMLRVSRKGKLPRCNDCRGSHRADDIVLLPVKKGGKPKKETLPNPGTFSLGQKKHADEKHAV